MSYMPAEENDDFDYEEGFLGDEDIFQHQQSVSASAYSNSAPSPSSQQAHGETFVDKAKMVSNPPKSDSHRHRPDANGNECVSKATVLSPPNKIFERKPSHSSKGSTAKTWKPSPQPSLSSLSQPSWLLSSHKPSPSTSSSSHPSSYSSSYTVPASCRLLTEDDFKMAAVKGNVSMVQKCLDQGFSPNQVLSSGWTVLMHACNHSQPAVVEILMGKGADASCHTDMYTALMCACSTSCQGQTSLECVKLLVEDGKADINAQDRQHSTALMLASRLGHLDLVQYLIQTGSKVNQQDARGWTALTWAVQRGHKEVVVALLEAGADCQIRHSDRLTVKDMAAHLPSDEMLALLERRPFVSSGGGDLSSIGIAGTRAGSNTAIHGLHPVQDEGDGNSKSIDLRYGEMEIFLMGLGLAELVPMLQKHLIDFYLLLDLTEQDLINAGVEQVGARKKILEASQAVHKKNWEVSSLVSVHFNKQICCSDAVAMVANISKHIRHINSTAVYITKHARLHPQSVLHATDRASPTQLLRHVADTRKHVDSLQTQLLVLQEGLDKEMQGLNLSPPDLIAPTTRRVITRRHACISGCVLGVVVVIGLAGYAWKAGRSNPFSIGHWMGGVLAGWREMTTRHI